VWGGGKVNLVGDRDERFWKGPVQRGVPPKIKRNVTHEVKRKRLSVLGGEG